MSLNLTGCEGVQRAPTGSKSYRIFIKGPASNVLDKRQEQAITR